MIFRLPALLLVLCSFAFGFASPAPGFDGAIVLQLAPNDTNASVLAKAKFAVNRESTGLNKTAREYWQSVLASGKARPNTQFIAPRIGMLRAPNGSWVQVPGPDGVDITLDFPASGNNPGPFANAYKQVLIDAYAAAKPVLDILLGSPFQGGPLKVYNMDATIGDRDAVAGGVYFPVDPNGGGGPAIWFPEYTLSETATVNFVHLMCLAYVGQSQFGFDAWSEGIARAATMRTLRLWTPPAGLDNEIIANIISNSYDNSATYSWCNQPPLGNNKFIAPNLQNQPLPVGGSLGGLYLMRYRQAGTAWAKLVTEYPSFLQFFLGAYYVLYNGSPGIATNIPGLVSLVQSTMDALTGSSNSTVEGRTFANWYRRQYVFDTSITRGRKMFVEAIPVTSGLGGQDYGVFILWSSYFDTLAGGNELLLSGTGYPLYWDSDFTRFFASGQDDRVDFAAGFGSVTPNFVDLFGGKPYRTTVEVPVGETIGRVVLPSGAIATAADPSPNNFFGTVMGFDGNPNGSDKVRITLSGQAPVDAILRNGAFGATVPAPGFNQPRLAKIEVIQGASTIIATEFVNTWGPELGIDIRLNDEGTYVAPSGLSAGVQLTGFPINPWEKNIPTMLGLTETTTLVAKWRQDLFRYDLYPNVPAVSQGRSYFVRMPSAVPVFSVAGQLPGPQPISVAAQVGWNNICNPFMSPVAFSDVTVQRAAETPKSWSEAISAGWIDSNVYLFNPGANDPFSGVPEGGTFAPASNFPVGRGLFLRALVPEGVTVTFRPGTFVDFERTAQTSLPNNWKVRLDFSGMGVESSSIEVGGQVGAKVGFDVGIDSSLPPAWGGALQAEIASNSSLYRDVRGIGAQLWEINVSGLRVGKTYRLKFGAQNGNMIYSATVQDSVSGQSRIVRPDLNYTFVANSGERRFKLFAMSTGATR